MARLAAEVAAEPEKPIAGFVRSLAAGAFTLLGAGSARVRSV
jgi:hypothetical protein